MARRLSAQDRFHLRQEDVTFEEVEDDEQTK